MLGAAYSGRLRLGLSPTEAEATVGVMLDRAHGRQLERAVWSGFSARSRPCRARPGRDQGGAGGRPFRDGGGSVARAWGVPPGRGPLPRLAGSVFWGKASTMPCWSGGPGGRRDSRRGRRARRSPRRYRGIRRGKPFLPELSGRAGNAWGFSLSVHAAAGGTGFAVAISRQATLRYAGVSGGRGVVSGDWVRRVNRSARDSGQSLGGWIRFGALERDTENGRKTGKLGGDGS